MNEGLLKALGVLDQGQQNPLAMLAGLMQLQGQQENINQNALENARKDALLPLQMALTEKQITNYDDVNKLERAKLMATVQGQADDRALSQRQMDITNRYYQGILNNQRASTEAQESWRRDQVESANQANDLNLAKLIMDAGSPQRVLQNPALVALAEERGLNMTDPITQELMPLFQAQSTSEITAAINDMAQRWGIDPAALRQQLQGQQQAPAQQFRPASSSAPVMPY